MIILAPNRPPADHRRVILLLFASRIVAAGCSLSWRLCCLSHRSAAVRQCMPTYGAYRRRRENCSPAVILLHHAKCTVNKALFFSSPRMMHQQIKWPGHRAPTQIGLTPTMYSFACIIVLSTRVSSKLYAREAVLQFPAYPSVAFQPPKNAFTGILGVQTERSSGCQGYKTTINSASDFCLHDVSCLIFMHVWYFAPFLTLGSALPPLSRALRSFFSERAGVSPCIAGANAPVERHLL